MTISPGTTLKRQLPTRPSGMDPRDYDVKDFIFNSYEYPDSLDFRGHLPRVRNQGVSGVGSTFSIACLQSWRQRRKIRDSGYMSTDYFDHFRTHEEETKMTWTLRQELKVLKKHGICTHKTFAKCKSTSQAMRNKSLLRQGLTNNIYAYARVTTVQDLQKSLFKNGPALLSFAVYNFSKTPWKRENKSQNCLGGHCVAVVGYMKNHFILRNSWGEKWGNRGHTYLNFHDFNHVWDVWTPVKLKRTSVNLNFHKDQNNSKRTPDQHRKHSLKSNSTPNPKRPRI